MTSATFLLPAAARFGAQRWQPDIVRALGRADRSTAAPGRRPQLARHVDLPGGGWPLAALSRQVDVGDAGAPDNAWLRADPAWLQPDINGVRLMGHGDTLGLVQADVDALLPALQPIFADAGFALDAPAPSRWYLRLPRETALPVSVDPSEALGTDLADHDDGGAQGRRWRALANEAQILLHTHPWNAARAAAGRPPVNALWFWGGGPLPDGAAVARSAQARVLTDDATLCALAAIATEVDPLPSAWPALREALLIDLGGLRDLRQLQADWLRPALAALAGGRLDTLVLDHEDGLVLTLRRWHRLRVWRRPHGPATAAQR
ncbi:phosphoglycerate mutase [Luteimonas sp. TWI662]|uniref:phosphoglycerate mutase n=1 Tax=unclassified Luteimonas TaxID=2629088 RepID=UPI00320B76C1